MVSLRVKKARVCLRLHSVIALIIALNHVVLKISPLLSSWNEICHVNVDLSLNSSNKTCGFTWCLMKKAAWFSCLGYQKPSLLTTLNVMSGFFLVFDITMDISRGKFISTGKSSHSACTSPKNEQKGYLPWFSDIKSVLCNRIYWLVIHFYHTH